MLELLTSDEIKVVQAALKYYKNRLEAFKERDRRKNYPDYIFSDIERENKILKEILNGLKQVLEKEIDFKKDFQRDYYNRRMEYSLRKYKKALSKLKNELEVEFSDAPITAKKIETQLSKINNIESR